MPPPDEKLSIMRCSNRRGPLILSRSYVINELLSDLGGVSDREVTYFIMRMRNIQFEEAIAVLNSRFEAAKLIIEEEYEDNPRPIYCISYSTAWHNMLVEGGWELCHVPITSMEADTHCVSWSGMEETMGRDPIKARHILDLIRPECTAYETHNPYKRHPHICSIHGLPSSLYMIAPLPITEESIELEVLHPAMLIEAVKLTLLGKKIWRWWKRTSLYDISFSRAKKRAEHEIEALLS